MTTDVKAAKKKRLAALKASMEARTAENLARQQLYLALGADGAEANDEAMKPLWEAANAAIKKAAIASKAFHAASDEERKALYAQGFEDGRNAPIEAR